MLEGDAPWVAELADAITTSVTERLTADFAPRHDLLNQRLTEMEKELAAAYERLAAFEQRLKDIHGETAFTKVMAEAAFGGTLDEAKALAPQLKPDTPRPVAIDDACAADPEAGPQRVDLIEFGTTIYVLPGSDPARLWADTLRDQAAVLAEFGPKGSRR